MRAIDMEEKRAEKKGELTPKALVSRFSEDIENLEGEREVETVLMVSVDKGGEVHVGYSSCNMLKALGMVNIAQQTLIDETRE